MTLHRQQLEHAKKIEILTEVFEWVYGFGTYTNVEEQLVKRENFLRKIGESLDFSDDYIEAAIKRELKPE